MPSSSWRQAGKLILNHLPAMAAVASESKRIPWLCHAQLALNWPQPGPGILDLKDDGAMSLVSLVILRHSDL